jgi:hypothetical protein
MLALRAQHTSIVNLIDIATMITGAPLDRLLDHIEREFMRFLAQGDDDKPYSRCARSFITAQSSALLTRLRELRDAASLP